MDAETSLSFLRFCCEKQLHTLLLVPDDPLEPSLQLEDLFNKLLGEKFSVHCIRLNRKTTQKEFCRHLMASDASKLKSASAKIENDYQKGSSNLIENIYGESCDSSGNVAKHTAEIHSHDIAPASKYQQHPSDLIKVFLIHGIENALVEVQSSLLDLLQSHAIDMSTKLNDSSSYVASFPFAVCCTIPSDTRANEASMSESEAKRKSSYSNFSFGRLALSLRKSIFISLFISNEWATLVQVTSGSRDPSDEQMSKIGRPNLLDTLPSFSDVYISTNIDRYIAKIMSCIRMKVSPHGSASPFFASMCGANVTLPKSNEHGKPFQKKIFSEEEWVTFGSKILATMRDRQFVTTSDVQTMLYHCLVHKLSHIFMFKGSVPYRTVIMYGEEAERAIAPEGEESHFYALQKDVSLSNAGNLDALYAAEASCAASTSHVSPFLCAKGNVPFMYADQRIDMLHQGKLIIDSLEKIKPPA